VAVFYDLRAANLGLSMANIILILVGLIVGVGIAYFISSDLSAAWGNIPCILGLILLLFFGQELLTPNREGATPGHAYYRRSDGEDSDDA
jgi:hypothetical protein